MEESKATQNNPEEQKNSEDKNELLKAGKILNKKRLEKGLSKTQLSLRTKISSNVIEAIEKGWINELPEKTYLITMINKLEIELNLDKGSLKGVLIKTEQQRIKRPLKFFMPGNIEIFTTWQGNLIYILVMLFSLLIINKSQKELSIINTQTSEPIQAIIKSDS